MMRLLAMLVLAAVALPAVVAQTGDKRAPQASKVVEEIKRMERIEDARKLSARAD